MTFLMFLPFHGFDVITNVVLSVVILLHLAKYANIGILVLFSLASNSGRKTIGRQM